MTNGGNAWSVDQAAPNSIEDTIDKKKVPVFYSKISIACELGIGALTSTES